MHLATIQILKSIAPLWFSQACAPTADGMWSSLFRMAAANSSGSNYLIMFFCSNCHRPLRFAAIFSLTFVTNKGVSNTCIETFCFWEIGMVTWLANNTTTTRSGFKINFTKGMASDVASTLAWNDVESRPLHLQFNTAEKSFVFTPRYRKYASLCSILLGPYNATAMPNVRLLNLITYTIKNAL